ncbi:methionine synthase [Auraticoccus sp. F435]|uniref:Methionine synthase n=2 Tax=Auraticoccus cholistanensis TaxID=2656650 RepID=A0A6A9V0P7_9ACTN|nr:methionine synthase [Auraticoccus cholistanensis]MVA75999.1 methionine synthase [Auraticoccus cholistanensis]
MAAALRLTLGELGEADGPGVPYLPELPARGVHAQLLGRSGAVLSGLSLDLQPAGWRLTDGPGVDARRARSLLRQDLDLLEEAAQGYRGAFTLTCAGPWTLAAGIERPRGDRVLADSGARRELGQSLAEGLADLVAEVSRRLPDLELAVQLDEPQLPAVMAGSIRTASGFSRHRRVDRPEVSQALQQVVEAVLAAGGQRVRLHCCAPGLDVALVLGAGVGGLLLDADQLTAADLDRLAEALESGAVEVGLGVQPTAVPDAPLTPDQLATRALRVLQPLELGPDVAGRVLLTPACGLAGWSAAPATRTLRALVRATAVVTEELGR